MRGDPSSIFLSAPSSLNEALAALAAGETPFAGGTDLMVAYEAGRLPAGRYCSLHLLPELRGIHLDNAYLTIGACVTYTQILRHPTIAVDWPMLANAASLTGAVAIQSRGTIGGNIANASPAADTPPALVAYDAEIGLISARGLRWLPYRKFHSGYKTTARASDELVHSVRVPRRQPNSHDYYRKVGPRKAQAISKVCVAATATVRHGVIQSVGVGIGSVGATVVDASGVASVLVGQVANAQTAEAAASWLRQHIQPIDDIRSTGRYRLAVASNLVRDFVLSL